MPRILIVEDSPTQAQQLLLILLDAGFEAEAVRDAARALELLRQRKFDLVLSDLLLPGDSGFDLCRRIRADPRLRSVRVMVLTSQTDPANVLRGLAAGADGFMTKDREPQEVVGRVRRVLTQKTRDELVGDTGRSHVVFLGQPYEISAGREQLLDVLVAAFEDVVHLNDRYRAEIAQRRQVEAELVKARAAAEASSRAKSEFLAHMSHEIRTPMNGVLGMTELLLDTQISPEQRTYLQLVKGSADALLTVINDILDFSKIEAGKLTLDPVPFALRELLHRTLAPLALQAGQRQVELAVQVDPDVPDQLVGDPGRVRQIVINLVGNAIKFTERGAVVVAVARTHKAAEDNGQSVELQFSVADSGIGIPAEKQSRIFEAFAQADSSTTRKYGGTGLGLTISARLVAMMGGRIWLHSTLGQGSTFLFTARFDRAKEPLPAPLAPSPSSGALPAPRGLRILLAEDNYVNQLLAVRLLERQGHRVVIAGTGREALRLQAEQTFDLCLMDVQMPEMDGFQATACIRQQEKDTGRHLPILAMTAHAMREDQEKCLASGMDGYVSKPVKPRDLFDAIAHLVPVGPRANEQVPDGASLCDREKALLRVGGDEKLLREVTAVFLQSYPLWVGELRQSVTTGDAKLLHRAAHSLRGAVSLFAARDAIELVSRLETMGQRTQVAGAAGLLDALELELERLRPQLEIMAQP